MIASECEDTVEKLEMLQSTMKDRNSAIKFLAEHNELKEGLLLAQTNISKMGQSLVQFAAENKILIESVHNENEHMMEYITKRLEKAFETLNVAVQDIDNSNSALKLIMNTEVEKVLTQARNENNQILVAAGVSAIKEIDKAVSNFDNRLNKISGLHQAIVDEVRKVYRYAGHAQVFLWIWRWVMFALLLVVVRNVARVEGVWGWIKVLIGLAFF